MTPRNPSAGAYCTRSRGPGEPLDEGLVLVVDRTGGYQPVHLRGERHPAGGSHLRAGRRSLLCLSSRSRSVSTPPPLVWRTPNGGSGASWTRGRSGTSSPCWTGDRTTRDGEMTLAEFYDELPSQWTGHWPGKDPGTRSIHEFRIGVLLPSRKEMDRLRAGLARVLCPDPGHNGACPIPWSTGYVDGHHGAYGEAPSTSGRAPAWSLSPPGEDPSRGVRWGPVSPNHPRARAGARGGRGPGPDSGHPGPVDAERAQARRDRVGPRPGHARRLRPVLPASTPAFSRKPVISGPGRHAAGRRRAGC
ncbi:Hypothetical protein SCLAV_p0375, partial (plasmid) [Streptomyces clavuligerus]